MRRWWIGGLPAAALVIAGCGGVSIAPEPVLPKALVVAIPAKVGFVVAGEQRTYSHNEERGGVQDYSFGCQGQNTRPPSALVCAARGYRT